MSFIAITELDNLIISQLEMFDWSNIAMINKASYEIMRKNPYFCEWDCINAAKEQYILRTQNKHPVDLWFDNMVLKNLSPKISDQAIETKCIMKDPHQILFYYACHFGSLYVAEFLTDKIKLDSNLFTESLMATCRSNHFHIYGWLRTKTVTIETNKMTFWCQKLEDFNARSVVHANKFEDTLYYLITRHKNEQLEWFLREAMFLDHVLRNQICVAYEHLNKYAFELLCDQVSPNYLRTVFNYACAKRKKMLIMWLHERNSIDISADGYSAYQGSPTDIQELLEQLYDVPKNLQNVLHNNDKTYTYDGVLGRSATKREIFCTKKERHPRKILTKHQSKQIIRR